MPRPEETSDEELIRAHLGGSVSAFERLVGRHTPPLAAVLERLVHDHHLALDLAQEVIVKLYRMLPRYRFQGRFRAMLYSMALNGARDALRAKRRSRLVFLEESGAAVERATAHDPTPARDERALIEEALDRVPSPFREAVYLRDVAGLSYEEAAAALGCNVGTVKSRINRGRLAFRDHYTGLMERSGDGSSWPVERPQGEQHAT